MRIQFRRVTTALFIVVSTFALVAVSAASFAQTAPGQKPAAKPVRSIIATGRPVAVS